MKKKKLWPIKKYYYDYNSVYRLDLSKYNRKTVIKKKKKKWQNPQRYLFEFQNSFFE